MRQGAGEANATVEDGRWRVGCRAKLRGETDGGGREMESEFGAEKNCLLENTGAAWLTPAVLKGKSNASLAMGLVIAVALWGGNNAGTKWLVSSWPPIWTGGTRFLCAGFLLLGVLRVTKWFGEYVVPSREMSRALWLRGGLSLAAYIVAFNYALRFTSASHVALYLGAAPVWALLWEAWSERIKIGGARWGAALLALSGVGVLLAPALANSNVSLVGELCGLITSVLWTNYGRQSRKLSATLNGAEVSAHTMWRAGVLLLPLALVEVAQHGVPWSAGLVGVQAYCIIAGGVVAFALWNRALGQWPASRVLLFNNLIPVSTMIWAHFCLNEPVTRTFLLALLLIGIGVVLGQVAARSSAKAEPAEL
jgi:drug/metabolite transporter (DMT)-like permease